MEQLRLAMLQTKSDRLFFRGLNARPVHRIVQHRLYLFFYTNIIFQKSVAPWMDNVGRAGVIHNLFSISFPQTCLLSSISRNGSDAFAGMSRYCCSRVGRWQSGSPFEEHGAHLYMQHDQLFNFT